MSYREQRIRDTLNRRRQLRLVENDLFKISNRIQRIDRGYFILQNMRDGSYEVHNTNNIGSTYCFAVPYGELDARTLEYCRYTSTGRNVVKEVEQRNEKIKQARQRANHNDLVDRSLELADRVGMAYEKDELHDGYKRTFTVS